MVFKKFESDDIVSASVERISSGIWVGGTGSWSTFATNSYQSEPFHPSQPSDPANGLYYTNMYDGNQPTSDVFFSVTYGNLNGSGSSNYDINVSKLFPTKLIYSQYKNLLLSPGDEKFTFNRIVNNAITTEDTNEIYVISFRNVKIKDRLDNSLFEITLRGKNEYAEQISIPFVDESTFNTSSVEYSQKRYELVRGTISNGCETKTIAGVTVPNYEGIGAMYPDLGIIVLNAIALDRLFPKGTAMGPSFKFVQDADSSETLFAMKHKCFADSIIKGAKIQARCTEYVPSKYYFVRAKNKEFNYSNNPSFVINSDEATSQSDIGKIRFNQFYLTPKVYPTAVGLYDSDNNLVAVAKLSRPILKDFSNELLVRIRLDY